jgi:hypothetical protein
MFNKKTFLQEVLSATKVMIERYMKKQSVSKVAMPYGGLKITRLL